MATDAERHRRLRAVFDEAVLLDVSARDGFLDRACDGDSSLRAHAARLLAAHDTTQSFLDRPVRLSRPEDESAPPFTGTNRFRVLRELGRGGMGVVYEVHDAERDEIVALKTFQHAGAGDLYRLKREFRGLAGVAHPNIVCLYELFVEDERPFFTMERVHGASFVAHVRGADGNQLSVDRLGAALPQLVDGLSWLHRHGMLHRDVKPSNVLVTSEGRVVILDFGLIVEAGGDRARAAAGGTPAYMSPEECAGALPSEAGDWYSVGVALYEALTGRLPFAGTVSSVLAQKQTSDPIAPAIVAPAVPSELSAVCMALLHRDRASRANGDDVLRALALDRQRTGERSDTAFVGRSDQLEALRRAADALGQKEPRTVFIHGQSGIGKSALVRRFLSQLDRTDAVILQGRCYENEAIPYKALDGVIDELSFHLNELPGADIEALLPADAPALARVFPVLRRIDSIERAARQTSTTDLDPIQVRRRAIDALRGVLGRIAQRQRLVVWIDDLQWADADSLQLLDDIFAPPNQPAMLTLLSFRSEELATKPFLRALLDTVRDGWSDLALEPMAEADARSLIDHLLPAASVLSEDDRKRLALEAAGSPFVLEQLATYAGLPRPHDGTPPTVAAMFERRFETLATEARLFLQTLALCAAPMPAAVICDASGIDHDRQSLIVALRTSRLIRSSGSSDQIETYHDRIRESVSAGVPPQERRGIHGRIAAALRARHSDDVEALFEHCRGAEHLADAAEYAGQAGAKAAAALAFDRAATFYQHALDAASSNTAALPHWKRQLAIALTNAGRPADAADAYVRAAADANRSEQVALQRAAAEQYLIGGHIDQGLGLLDQVLRGVGLSFAASPRRAVSRLLWHRARLAWRGLGFRESRGMNPEALLRLDACWAAATGLGLVDIPRASDFITQHLHLALDAGDPARIARGLALEASARHADWIFRPSARKFEALAAQLSERIKTPNTTAMLLLADALSACANGQWRRALASSERSLAILRDECVGVTWERTIAQNMFLWSLMYRGQLGELSRIVPTLLQDARRRGNLYLAAELTTRCNFVWLAADDPDAGEREVTATMAQWSQQGFHRQHYSAMLARMQTALYRGDPRSAWRILDEHESEWRASMLMRVQALRVEYTYMRGRSAIAMASTGEDQSRWLSTARRYARRLAREQMPWSNPIGRLLDAGIASVEGDRGTSEAALTEAINGFDRADMQLYASVARRRSSELRDDDHGRGLRQHADTWMAEQQIKNPDHFTRMFAPGLWHARM